MFVQPIFESVDVGRIAYTERQLVPELLDAVVETFNRGWLGVSLKQLGWVARIAHERWRDDVAVVDVEVLPAVDHITSHAAVGERSELGGFQLVSILQISELRNQVEGAHLDSLELADVTHSPW